jgi:hypothetical protein|tara:strand:- start:219 stop:1985 length:1767 start_codon:yes stop_codon:yes gene_type:complete
MKTYILVVILMVSTLHVFSQKKSKKGVKNKDSIIEVINVVTSYTPKISDAFKLKKSPKIILSENTKKKKLSYAIFSAPVASTFVPKSGVVKGIDVGIKERLYDNYLALGFGNYTTPYIEVFLHQNRKYETDYGVYLNYISSENSIKNTSLNTGYSTLNLGGYYMKKAQNFSWKIGGNVQQQKYNWYGLPAITFDQESIEEIAEKQAYGFYELEGELVFEDSYFSTIKTSLSLFDDLFGSKEIGFTLKSNFNFPLTRINRNLKDLELQTSIHYLQGEFQQNYLNEATSNYRFFNVGIHPIYRINWNKLNIKLGTKIYLTSDIENSLTDVLAYPDIEISYPLISGLLNLYTGAGGDLHMNSFQSFSEQNPFVSPTLFLTQTNEQYNLFGGITGTVSSNISFNLKASYKSDEDHALFLRNNSKSNGIFNATTSLLGYEYGNSFNVFYDNISTLSIFGEIEIAATKRVVIGANIQSNSYTTTFQQEAWNLPKLEGAIFGKYKNDKWYANANIFFVGERLDVKYNGTFPSTISNIQSLDAFADINLNGGYHFNDFFSAFIKLNNILATDYERYANFNVQGFQALAGITYKFDF